jgi:hypothetical protein
VGRLNRITMDERAAAIEAAVSHAQLAIGERRGVVSPQARIGSLSAFEWQKLVEAIVSGWIIERSRQLAADRLPDEIAILAMGSAPEPRELGTCASILPVLGDFVEKAGLGDTPIGNWSREDILHFVWTAADLVERASTLRDERPDLVGANELLRAG